MCGVVGAVFCDQDIEPWIHDSLIKLNRRGPDFAGSLKQKNIYLGATRLAMVDMHDRSNQPFRINESFLVFNGEIYNHARIRESLAKHYEFVTNSDTEVLAYILQEHGVEGLCQLNGMYAFVFYDDLNQKVLIARDRLGKKPLYYRIPAKGNTLFFCSLQSPLSDISSYSLNFVALINYLHLGFILDPITMNREVKSVKPMEAISIINTNNKTSHTKAKIKGPALLPDRNLRKIITDCVMSRVHGENSVSFSLSGGVDSTVIAIVLAEQGVDATAFSVIWSDSDKKRYNQDFEIATRTAASLNLELIPVDALNANEVPEYLDKYLEIMEEPNSNPTGLSMISLYREIASNGFRLTLTGDGSDEIFGGYSRYEFIRKYEKWADRSALSKGAKFLRFGLMNKFLRLTSLSWQDWASWHQVFSKKELLQELKLDPSEINEAFQYFEEEFKEIIDMDEKSALKRMMLLDQKIWLAMESNRRLDRISMFFSVEARSPFQDDVLGALWINRNKKEVSQQIGKLDLLKAFPELQDLQISKKKMGFSSPLGHWLRANSDWVIHRVNWLESIGIIQDRLSRAEEIKSVLNGGIYIEMQKLWTLVVLSSWLQRNQLSGSFLYE